MEDFIPSPIAFKTVFSASIENLVKLSQSGLNSILPSLVRTAQRIPLDTSEHFAAFRKEIQKKIVDLDSMNSIVSFLNIDLNTVCEDAIKEQHLRKKLGGIKLTDDLLSESLQKGLLLEFEESNSMKKMRLVLSEILRIASLVQESENKFIIDETELFDCKVYLEAISNVVCVAFSELPFLLPICDVTEALLRVRYGPYILCRLVANNPDCFDLVCSSILSHATSSDEFEIETEVRTRTLKMMCSMNPKYAKILRAECVSLRKLAGLAITLSIQAKETVSSESDVVTFLTGLLLASDNRTKTWLAEYIKSAQKGQKENALDIFKAQLIAEMKNVINIIVAQKENIAMDTGENDSSLLNDKLMHGIAIMRLYCVLKSMSGFKLATEDSVFLIDLITSEPPATPVGVRFVVVALCTLVACSFLLTSEERETKVIDWLKTLVQQSKVHEKETSMDATYGETLLLIAIHFHGHSLEPIVDLVCSTLGIKLRPGSLTKIKILFTQQVFQEKVVAEHALTVPVTKNLNRSIKVFLPVHCIHQLMKSRVFSKHCISVKKWLFDQICSCSGPLHPLMIPLIEIYINSIINPLNISKTKHQHMSALQPFSEEKLLAVFTGTIDCYDILTTKLLLMLYVLMYQDSLLSSMKTLATNPKAPREYSTNLYSLIPMKQLLLVSRTEGKLYGDLYPPLLKLLIAHYPHLCLVEDSIVEEEIYEDIKQSTLDKGTSTLSDHFEMSIKNVHDSPSQLISLLIKLSMMQPASLIKFLDSIIKLLPELLHPKSGRRIQILTMQIWTKLNTVVPRKLWLKTVNVLRKQPDYAKEDWQKIPEYSEEDIKKDPLIALRVDPRVYRCPPLFDILLRVLNGYLTASRSVLNHHLLSNPVIPGSKPQPEIVLAEQEREELKSALIGAQESSALQILLEVCLPLKIEKSKATYSVKAQLREIQCKVCCFIHQRFILQPGLAKLLHFQGYPPELLNVTVAGVPSMHICIDFIPELLNQPHLEKQLFAVQLISHLAVQYPIPKSFSMSKYVLTRINNLLVGLPAAKRNQFFVPALASLVLMCKAFPPLRETVTEFMIKLGKVASSQLSKHTLTYLPMIKIRDDSSPDEKLFPENNEFVMEVDPETGDKCDPSELDTSFFETMKFSHDTFMKPCSSQELLEETKKKFEDIVNMSLTDKLSLIDDEKVIVDEL